MTSSEPTTRPRSLWITRPSIDLIVGCGGWSLPLLAAAYQLTGDAARAWSASFYALALVVNYPHYMATIYRAYGRGEWRRHTPYSVWATLGLVALGAVAHVETALVPILFTAYVMWSPWHYSGQNYGLLVMFARRGGYEISPGQQRLLKSSFVASYLMLLASFNNGPSADPLVLSAGLPEGVVRAIGVVSGLLFAGGVAVVVTALVRQGRRPALVPALMLLGTQALWFVVPIAADIVTGAAAPQTRYSSGALALMHSAQYLWITQHFARREQGEGWSGARYWLAVIAGGMALFLPVPWLVSSLGGLDFMASMLTVTAIVNLHHFMMDGVVWKLRDPRVAAALTTDASPAAPATGWWRPARIRTAAVTVAALALAALAAIDQWRYRLASRESDAASLQQAIALNPYDTAAQSRLLRLLTDSGRYDEARAQLDRLVAAQPRNIDAHVNAGVLARRTDRSADAIAHWQHALAIDPDQPQVQLYLAEVLHESGRAADALPHYQAFLESLTDDGAAARPEPAIVAGVVLKFGDALEQSGQREAAASQFGLALRIATQAKLEPLASQARQRLAGIR